MVLPIWSDTAVGQLSFCFGAGNKSVKVDSFIIFVETSGARQRFVCRCPHLILRAQRCLNTYNRVRTSLLFIRLSCLGIFFSPLECCIFPWSRLKTLFCSFFARRRFVCTVLKKKHLDDYWFLQHWSSTYCNGCSLADGVKPCYGMSEDSTM